MFIVHQINFIRCTGRPGSLNTPDSEYIRFQVGIARDISPDLTSFAWSNNGNLCGHPEMDQALIIFMYTLVCISCQCMLGVR